MCGGFPHIKKSDTNYPELVHTPPVEGSVVQDCPQLQMPGHLEHISVPFGYK